MRGFLLVVRGKPTDLSTVFVGKCCQLKCLKKKKKIPGFFEKIVLPAVKLFPALLSHY